MHLSLTSGLAAGLTLLTLAISLPPAAHAAPPKPTGVLSYTVQDIDGKSVPLSRYKGKVLMIVNTASLCGNTPQYASLEKLNQKYKASGLRILAFPANDFGQQEPGTNGEIRQFCTAKYNATFDLFSKVSVKAPNQAPLYTFLTSKETNPKFGGDIEWNFAKFLVDRKGQVVARFQAGHDPLSPDVVTALETELKKARQVDRRGMQMSEHSAKHFHLTHKRGRSGCIVRQPETITAGDAAMRLLEEIAARFVQQGCRVTKYSVGIRVYDCKNLEASDQSFEVHDCDDSGCGLTPSEGEYGRWTKADRHRYLLALQQRGLIA